MQLQGYSSAQKAAEDMQESRTKTMTYAVLVPFVQLLFLRAGEDRFP